MDHLQRRLRRFNPLVADPSPGPPADGAGRPGSEPPSLHPELALLLNTEPGVLASDNATAPCGPAPAAVLSWISPFETQNVDREWPEVSPGAHTLYVAVGAGDVRIGFNGVDVAATDPANASAVDARTAYNATFVDVPVTVTTPSPIEATAAWSGNLTGASLVFARFSVTMQGTGADQRAEGSLVQGGTECDRADFADAQRPILPVLGVAVSAYLAPGETHWNALARTDFGTEADIRISRFILIEADPDVERPFWL